MHASRPDVFIMDYGLSMCIMPSTACSVDILELVRGRQLLGCCDVGHPPTASERCAWRELRAGTDEIPTCQMDPDALSSGTLQLGPDHALAGECSSERSNLMRRSKTVSPPCNALSLCDVHCLVHCLEPGS